MDKRKQVWAAWICGGVSRFRRPQKVDIFEDGFTSDLWHKNGNDSVPDELGQHGPNGYGLVTFSSYSKEEVQNFIDISDTTRIAIMKRLGWSG